MQGHSNGSVWTSRVRVIREVITVSAKVCENVKTISRMKYLWEQGMINLVSVNRLTYRYFEDVNSVEIQTTPL